MTANRNEAVTGFSVAATDVPLESWDDDARGRISWHTLVSADRTPSAELTAGLAILEPGGVGVLHRHRHAPAEVYFGVSGRGVVTIDDTEVEIGPGIAVFIPRDAWHGVRSVGPDELRFYYSFAVGSFGDVEYHHEREVRG